MSPASLAFGCRESSWRQELRRAIEHEDVSISTSPSGENVMGRGSSGFEGFEGFVMTMLEDSEECKK
jgi:hypothetical protein